MDKSFIFWANSSEESIFPKNYAEVATEGALKNREQNIARLKAKQEKLHQEALAKAEQIEKIGSIELSAKAGESGKLFGTRK